MNELTLQAFLALASQGYTCKDIGNAMSIPAKVFGKKMKRLLGEYPSVYIAKMRRNETKKHVV